MMFWQILLTLFFLGIVGTIFSNVIGYFLFLFQWILPKSRFNIWTVRLFCALNGLLLLRYVWVFESGVSFAEIVFSFIAISHVYYIIKLNDSINKDVAFLT